MSYKTTRIYEVKLLDRLLDFTSLVDNAVEAIAQFSADIPIEGYIGCTISITYPDLDLLDRRMGGWRRRVKRFTQKIHRRFADVDWSLTNMEGELFDTLDFAEDDPPHQILSAIRQGKYQLTRPIQLMIPVRNSILSSLLSLRVLLNMTFHETFQYESSVHMVTWVTTTVEPYQVTLYREEVARVPWRHWLRSENHEVLAKKLMKDRPEIEIRYAPSRTLHDRFILTKGSYWHLGHSIKNIGNKLSAITLMPLSEGNDVLQIFEKLWNRSQKIT